MNWELLSSIKLKDWKIGGEERWKGGKMEGWKIGRVEDWKMGGVGEVLMSYNLSLKSYGRK